MEIFYRNTNSGDGSNLESGESEFDEDEELTDDLDGLGNSEYDEIDAEGLLHFFDFFFFY